MLTREFNERVMREIAMEDARRRCVSVDVDLSNWIDKLFSAVDIESLVKEVLAGLE